MIIWIETIWGDLMEFQVTKDTKSSTYKDTLMIRNEVFVQEQGVPKDVEIDENEESCIYFVGYLDHIPVITARMLETNPNNFIMQRVATLRKHRNKGYGALILKKIEDYLRHQRKDPLIVLDAQDTAIKFYKNNDYRVDGNGFIKAGIPHHSMYKKL